MTEHGLLEGEFDPKKHSQMNFYHNKEEENMANSLVSIQIIPKTKNGEDVIPFVDAAIAIIDESGVKYQVQSTRNNNGGRTFRIIYIIQKMNEKMIELGCPRVISQVKISYTNQMAYQWIL